MTRLVFVHGFTQTAASWEIVASRVDPIHGVHCVDAPGHGTASHLRSTLWEGADELALIGGRAVYVGYSMGARLVLHVALAHPEVTTGVVLLGGTAGIDDDDERAARRRTDEERAESIERDGLEPFLDAWLAMPMFSGVPDNPTERASRRTNTAAGIASSLRLAGTGTQDPPLWSRLDSIDAPTLVLAGSRDAKFTYLGRRLAEGIGTNAQFRAVPDAGHAAHLEQPSAFTRILQDWLSATRDLRQTTVPR